jgi:aspartate aminotransferase
LLARQLPEVLIAASCSKNFGLYRERTGATIVVTQTPKETEIVLSQALGAARRLYSMPPAHGALIAGRVLASQELNELWRAELMQMTQRIQSLRSQLSQRLSVVTGQDFGFVAHEKGMFSFLGLTQAQVQVLRDTHAIHMLDSSRINVAGLTDQSIEPLALAIGTVIAQ